MPPKKTQPLQETSSPAYRPSSNDQGDSASTVKRRHSKHTEATVQPTPSTSKNTSLEPNIDKYVTRSAIKKREYGNSNEANGSIIERTTPLSPQTNRREPAIGETVKKKNKAIVHSSEQKVTQRSYAKLDKSRDSRVETTGQRKELNDAPFEETSTAATFKASKSTLMDRRKHGSSRFGHLSGVENSRRLSKRLSLDVGKPPREINSDSSDVNWDLSVEVLLGRQWRMFRVSPLHGFSRTPQALKQYSRELRTYLTATRAALPDAAEVRYTTAFTVLPELRWEVDRPEALQVEVLSLLEGRKPVTLYTGILLSWGRNAPPSTGDKCPLPLLLCTGVWRTMSNVHAVLCRLFDAVIQPMKLSQSNLEWISAISMKGGMPPPDKPLVMHYVQGTRRVLSYFLSALRVHKVWCEIHDTESLVVSTEDVEHFSEILQELGSTSLCVELSRLVLARIEFPNVILTRDGFLKMKNIESVDFILRYFCSEAISNEEFFETLDPSFVDSV